MSARNSHCHQCGTPYPEPLGGYPRTCRACGQMIWANPIPVSVLLVPIRDGGRTGLLVVRRGIEPQRGKLALVGGFLEEHESWQAGGAREVHEETGVTVDPASVEPLWFTSTEPRPDRVLLFGVSTPVAAGALPPHDRGNVESPERGVVFGPGGLEEVFAFPLHVEAARRFFAARGVAGPHGYTAR